METKLVNKVTTIRTVCVFLAVAANVVITNTIAAFAAVLLTVKNKLILIDAYDQIVLNGTSGVTLDTKVLRKTMSNLAFKCAQATLAYANSVNNNTLANLVKFKPYMLNRLTKEEIAVICQQIRNAANANAGALNFGIAASDITDLQSAIDLYLLSSSNPRQARITKKTAGGQIKKLIKEIYNDQFKGQMDIMINTLFISNPEFVKNYFFAREIIDLGSTKTKLRGSITDSNRVPLVNVSVIMRLAGQSAIAYQTLTLIDGTFEIVPVIPGNYDITYELRGFAIQTELNYHFKPGSEKKHKIILLLP